jgi:putative hydrolase
VSARSRPNADQTADVNADGARWLMELALVQETVQRRRAYQRAARTVLMLPQPLSELRTGKGLAKIPNIGPSSERILLEVLDEGTSPTATRALAEGPAKRGRQPSDRLFSDYISRAVADQILGAPLPDVVGVADYKGDLQMHSTFSDGDMELDRIAARCLELGYERAAVTDHSYGLPIARGMSMATAARQHEAIDAVNATLGGRFTLLKGVEANIGSDGALDLSLDERRLFEVVVAAPHSALQSDADQTGRMIAALSAGAVDILGHPTGRRYGQRAGVRARWGEVFAAAARNDVAIEIDGTMERQDVHWGLATDALAAGCLFALDSDAHYESELPFTRFALAHARLAGIPASRVVNCWPLDRLLAWTSSHR